VGNVTVCGCKEDSMTQSQLEQQSQGRGKTVKRVTNVDIIRRAGGGQYEFELTLDGTQEVVMQVGMDEVSTVQRSFQPRFPLCSLWLSGRHSAAPRWWSSACWEGLRPCRLPALDAPRRTTACTR